MTPGENIVPAGIFYYFIKYDFEVSSHKIARDASVHESLKTLRQNYDFMLLRSHKMYTTYNNNYCQRRIVPIFSEILWMCVQFFSGVLSWHKFQPRNDVQIVIIIVCLSARAGAWHNVYCISRGSPFLMQYVNLGICAQEQRKQQSATK